MFVFERYLDIKMKLDWMSWFENFVKPNQALDNSENLNCVQHRLVTSR